MTLKELKAKIDFIYNLDTRDYVTQVYILGGTIDTIKVDNETKQVIIE